MDLSHFKSFISDNVDWFQGRFRESEESVRTQEDRVGLRLPASLRWLLLTHGYWHATGIDRLYEAVDTTLRCRTSILRPEQILILRDRGDAGVVVLDTGAKRPHDEFLILETDAHRLVQQKEGSVASDSTYDSYGQYLEAVLEEEKEVIEPHLVKYKASDFGD